MSPNPSAIPFVKASACGNDFLLIDSAFAASDLAGLTRRICDRHSGVGADGVEWMFPDAEADIKIRLLNSDGSEAEISGNGTRCVAAMLCSEQGKETIAIRTGAGIKTCVLTGRYDLDYEFEMAMGTAEVEKELSVDTGLGQVKGIPVSMGNPHYVVFVREFAAQWQDGAARIGLAPVFRQGVNVELVSLEDESNISARFFERGVGETYSSGTGSCAAAVAAMAVGGAESPVRVHAPGGTQTVRVEGGQVFLRGPARLVCRGEFFPG
jgi:diaminopimelate epimerase